MAFGGEFVEGYEGHSSTFVSQLQSAIATTIRVKFNCHLVFEN